MKRLLTAALAATTLFTLAACSDDDDKSSLPGAVDDATGDTVDVGGAVTVPNLPGIEESCLALFQAMGAAGAATGGQGDAAEWSATMSALAASVPDDLQDDVETFSEAYASFLAVIAQHEGDANVMANADVMTALALISTPEVQDAANNISEYMDATCPNG